MEAFLLIPRHSRRQIVCRLECLEKTVQQAAEEAHVLPPDEILAVRQAAARLGMTPEGSRKARRAGRLKGVRINEKEWGFYTTELHRYQNRYNRNPYNPIG